MGDLTYRHPELIHLLWLALALVGALAWLELRRGEALSRFVSAVMQRRLATRASRSQQIARLGLILATFVLGIVALMRPQTRGATETISAGRVSADIMVVLDVSKSMLAEDAAPNRLGRAKAEIGDMLGALDGHRVGLVAFAGRAAVLAPLTPDYGFFRMILRGVDPRSVSRGGTRIGDALRKAIAAFGAEAGSKLIVLITDGEDHDSFPLDAAKEAAEAGIRVVAIGFGSEEGNEIAMVDPATGARKVLTDNDGNVVRSRLDGELLRQIALTTDGAYVPAGVAALDLESIVREHITPLVRESAQAAVRTVPAEKYPWFLLAALMCLIAATWLGGASAQVISMSQPQKEQAS
jgi:Mg-chelatase subunit ChlD